jgi:hypothetical protein
VSFVNVATTAVLSSWSKTLRSRYCSRNDWMARRTTRSFFHVMCYSRSLPHQNPRALKAVFSFYTAPHPYLLESAWR